MLGAEEARHDPNIMTGIEPSDLGFSYEIKIASRQLLEIDKVIKGCKLEIDGHVFDINLIAFGRGSFDVIIGIHVINGDGIHVDPSKIESVEAPRTSSEGEEQERAFQTLKVKLCNEHVLALPDGPKDFVVYCDASGLGLGCVLMQRDRANLVADALSRKERIKPKRIRSMNMTLQSDGALYYLDGIWVPLKGDVRTLIMDEAHKSKYSVHPRADKMYYDLRDRYWWPRMKKDIDVYVSRCLTCLQVKAKHQRPSSLQQQPTILEWKCERIAIDFVIKLPRTSSGQDTIWVIVDRLTKSAHFLPMYEDYKMDRLRFPKELNGVHDTFHLSNLKKCLANLTLQVPLDEIQVESKLNFVEEPVKILEREFKKLKRSRIVIVKVCWNSKRRPEFTWERKDQMRLKYPHLFSASSS
nr:putative reverse transcriptase domain-containing protein [Tanacetum cinerariifolium]